MKMFNLLKILLLMLSLFTFTQQTKNIIFFEYSAIADLISFQLSYKKNDLVNFPNLKQAFAFKNHQTKRITFKIYQIGYITEGKYAKDKKSKFTFYYYIDLDDKQGTFSNLPNDEFDILLLENGKFKNEAPKMSNNIIFRNELRFIPSEKHFTKFTGKPSETEKTRNDIQLLINDGMFTVDPEVFAQPDPSLSIMEQDLPNPHNLDFQLDMFVKLRDLNLKHVKIEENTDFKIDRLKKFGIFQREDKDNKDRFNFIYKRKIN